MSSVKSDALVFFGATIDLAYKKIFPSLQAMVSRGTLNVPVIGVANAGWTLEQLKERAKESVQKHGGLDPVAFETLSNLTMEPPKGLDSESIRNEKVNILKSIAPLGDKDVTRGQFKGYQSEAGVKPGSKTETFAALRIWINSPRWEGVPFYIRAGKCLPVTCTEIIVRLKRLPTAYSTIATSANYVRLRISPDVNAAF